MVLHFHRCNCLLWYLLFCLEGEISAHHPRRPRRCIAALQVGAPGARRTRLAEANCFRKARGRSRYAGPVGFSTAGVPREHRDVRPSSVESLRWASSVLSRRRVYQAESGPEVPRGRCPSRFGLKEHGCVREPAQSALAAEPDFVVPRGSGPQSRPDPFSTSKSVPDTSVAQPIRPQPKSVRPKPARSSGDRRLGAVSPTHLVDVIRMCEGPL